MSYFSQLNYTLANEDSSLELALLSENLNHLVSVAGSGGRVLPLLAKFPKEVTCVDLSREQLYLSELRMESLRALEHVEFLGFWGYPPASIKSSEREKLFRRIKLTPQTREFFQSLFELRNWESILYEGKWERTFSKLSIFNRAITGVKGLGLFSAMTESEHFNYLEKQFPVRAWNAVLFTLGNAHVFNSLLYKGSFPKKNIPTSSYQFYRDAFQRIFDQGPARQNFFLQILFFGKVLFSEGNPVECDPDVFRRAKSGVSQAEIHYVQGDIIDVVEKANRKVDFLSLSDVPSYFNGPIETQFMQRIRKSMADKGVVVIRNYLRTPKGTDYSGFREKTEDHQDSIQKEKVQMYKIAIYEKMGRHELRQSVL